jgi:azurin
MKTWLLLGSGILLACVGCNKSEAAPKRTDDAPPLVARPASSPPAAPTPAAPASATLPDKPAAKVELELSAQGSTMAFDKTALSVPAGAEVHLTLNVKGPGILSHNWVLVKTGTEASVAAAGLAKGAAESYVAPGPDVLAFTPLAAPGKSAEVTFKAPAPGAYPYVCTFPGHYMMMKGLLTVTP